MPAYLVELPARGGQHLTGGHDKMIVFAADADDARAMAAGHQDGDGALWADSSTTVTAIADGSALDPDDWSLYVSIEDTVHKHFTAEGGVLGAVAAAINAGGTGYSTNNILTVAGGTATRAATLRVTSDDSGVIDGIEIVDPGEYTALPSNPVSVTGGDGSSATFNLTGDTDQPMNYCAEMVGLLNAHADIANAAYDNGAATPLLTASGAADNLGDLVLVCEFRYKGVSIPSLIGTITDEGSAGAALTALVPAATSPNVVSSLRA